MGSSGTVRGEEGDLLTYSEFLVRLTLNFPLSRAGFTCRFRIRRFAALRQSRAVNRTFQRLNRLSNTLRACPDCRHPSDDSMSRGALSEVHMYFGHRGDSSARYGRACAPAALPSLSSLPDAPPRTRHRPLSLLVTIAATASASAFASPPLPQNGQFVAGSGSIARNGANLDITQSTTNGIVDWRSFSIGAGHTVSFNNGTGATLNRVTGNEMSVLNGRLTSTGSVYLINPQGVLIGPSGVVTTDGRFVASTLDADNNAFVQGGSLTLSGTSNGAVINLGKISSTGGDVFLVAKKAVANLGTIKAPNGTAELAAGTQVLLQDSSTGQQVFVQAGNSGQTLNAGTIRAAQISLQAADGNVYALAGKHSVLRATGTATRDGHVWLVADGGTVDARGATISAHDANGSGATVDMSADTIRVDGTQVRAALWNLTAPVFTIGASTARTLAHSLSAGTSVAVNTTGANGTTGDIGVQSDIRWRGASSLALNAYHSVTVAPNVTLANTGAGNLTLRADVNALDNGGSVTNRGTLDWRGSTGIVAALYDMTGSYTPGTIDTNAAWSAASFSGLVTQVTGYQLINSIADLNAVNNNLAGNYALGTNLTVLSDTISVPIGGVNGLPFTGQFDGMDHTVSGFDTSFATGNVSVNGPLGLFSVIGTTGVVRNLGVIDSGTNGIVQPGGILAGQNEGLIVNSYSTGSVGDAQYGGVSGGLVGENDGTIERSWSSASVGGFGALGGLVGVNTGLILQSYATGLVSTDIHGFAGGLVGGNTATGVINESYAAGSVDPNIFLGAVAGGGLVANNAGTIEQSFDASTMAQPYVPPGVPPSGFVFGGIASSNTGTIAPDVFWNINTTTMTTGVGTGTSVSPTNGLTTAQMSVASSFGPTYDFGPNGVWALPAGATHPVLRWQLLSQ